MMLVYIYDFGERTSFDMQMFRTLASLLFLVTSAQWDLLPLFFSFVFVTLDWKTLKSDEDMNLIRAFTFQLIFYSAINPVTFRFGKKVFDFAKISNTIPASLRGQLNNLRTQYVAVQTK